MERHQERILDEAKELSERRKKLKSFMDSKEFDDLIAEEQVDLYHQSAAMADYLLFLNRRIERFEKSPSEEAEEPQKSTANNN